MTPWLTIAIPTQPSQPARVLGLGRLLGQATRLASHPEGIHWHVLPEEGPAWTLGAKWRRAIAECQTDWLWLFADDTWLLTPAWDALMHAAAQHAQFALLHGQDGRFGDRLAGLPCLRRTFAQRVLPTLDDYGFYRIDDHIFDIAKRAGRVGFLPDILCLCQEAIDAVPYQPSPERYPADNEVYHRLTTVRDELVVEMTHHHVKG